MVTQPQRENRALFNLARADAPLTFAQLRCASVNGLALRELRQGGHVETVHAGIESFPETGEVRELVGWAITDRGREELEWRLIAGVASTITANGGSE